MTTIQFDLNVPQSSFLQLPHKFKAYVAGFGSGKTFVGCAGICAHFWQWPHQTVARWPMLACFSARPQRGQGCPPRP